MLCDTFIHTLITWPLASEKSFSYATQQCVGILLIFFIIQVTWPFDVWKQVRWQMLGKVQRKNMGRARVTFIIGCCNSRPSGEHFHGIHKRNIWHLLTDTRSYQDICWEAIILSTITCMVGIPADQNSPKWRSTGNIWNLAY